MEQLLQDSLHIAPITGLAILSLLVVLINSFIKNSDEIEYWTSLIGLGVIAVISICGFTDKGTAFNNMIAYGGFASFVSLLLSVGGLLVLSLSKSYARRIGAYYGEHYIIILIAIIGMIAFATATDLIVTFVGLELMSICLYILAGFTRKNLRANEASLKYFLLGAFATGFFLYGIALMYGAAGTTNIIEMAANIDTLQGSMLFLIGAGLLVIGFAFKVGAVPFHMWVPDVYEGAPTTVSAFMSTAAKTAAFAAFLFILTVKFNLTNTSINLAIAIIATASMVVGNVVAISQNNVKRMLAYSSIAHAGYMLIGIAAGSEASVTGILFYLTSYTFTNIGAFGIITLFEDDAQTPVTISKFNGMGLKRPLVGILMSIFMFSLIGIPPLSGFFGKYYIFAAAISQGYTWLTIVGVLTSMVSVFYYLRIVVAMYFKDAESEEPIYLSTGATVTLLLSAAAIMIFGFGPNLLLQWLDRLF
jgi:NADH-quinone oxidoreductase subunit N